MTPKEMGVEILKLRDLIKADPIDANAVCESVEKFMKSENQQLAKFSVGMLLTEEERGIVMQTVIGKVAMFQ